MLATNFSINWKLLSFSIFKASNNRESWINVVFWEYSTFVAAVLYFHDIELKKYILFSNNLEDLS